MYIDHKLGLGFGGIVGLVLLLAMLAWQNMQMLVGMERGHDRLQQMRESLLEARRHEKNFLLRHEDTWAEQTREWMVKLSHQIRDEEGLGGILEIEVWREAGRMVQEYLDRFEQIVGDKRSNTTELIQAVEIQLVPVARKLNELLIKRLSVRSDNQSGLLERTERFYAGFVIFAMLFSSFMVFFLTRSIVRSLQAGVRFSQEIAHGNLGAKIIDIPPDEIGILLTAMQKMGEDLQRLEEVNLRAQTSRLAMSALLESSLEPLTLQRQLEVVLQIVLTVPFLHFQRKGAIFLADDEEGTLQMVASDGLSVEINRTCQTVAPGWCLCGRAAVEGKLLYVSGLDERHENRYEGMGEHGHYCVPIVSRGKVLAVMTLYLDPRHVWSAEEEAFLSGVAFTVAGILERKRLEERMQHLAHHDLLTALPNRVLFAEHLSHALAQATRGQEPLALMLVDLDRFKQVNDTLGHAAGDQVLITTTQRIRECLRASDLVARMGGDEFAVILADLTDPTSAGLVADKIVQSVSQPIIVAGQSVNVGASIGIAVFPTHGDEGDELMACADMAMYAVKERGRNGYRFFEKGDRKSH
ncbi:MAG: diguanylate cyclase [Magnetococcales bacterium]|nr:diguanylate cyclase [Magnetococcales bacterium]